MNKASKENDWKTFRKRVPEWRERYLQSVDQDLIRTLADPERTPTAQFWDTDQQMKEQARILRKCLAGHSRSKLDLAHALPALRSQGRSRALTRDSEYQHGTENGPVTSGMLSVK